MSADNSSSARPSALLRRSFRKDYPIATRGDGVWLWDAHGTKYLDFSGSAAVNFIGHGVAEIPQAMLMQANSLEFIHSSQFTTQVAEEFAAELIEFAGEHFMGGKVYFCSGGSEAVETALKLARQYQVETGHPERYEILSRNQSYHGSTLGALAVSGNRKRREIYLPMVHEPAHIDVPYCYRCNFDCTDGCAHCGLQYAAQLEEAILETKGAAAGFIFEPISGATLGAVTPPPGYLNAIAGVCRRHEVLLIADEVMTGMGRTGRNFAVDHYKVAPDILVAAKGLSSGYAPLGAVIATKAVTDSIAQGSGSLMHGFTYNAHPISVAAGSAVLRHVHERKLIAAADSQTTGTIAFDLKSALQPVADLPAVGEVRGFGLLWGIEFVRDKATKQPYAPEINFAAQVAAATARRGVLVYPMQGCVDGTRGDHLLIAPPAIITPGQIRLAIDHLGDAIQETTRMSSASF